MNKITSYILAVLVIMGLGFLYWNTSVDEAAIETSVSVAEAMAGGGDQEGYQRVTGPRDFTFPDDHGPHPGYKTEWWYYTGNLFTDDGRQFGYQFTIFRNQLQPPATGATADGDSAAAAPGTGTRGVQYSSAFAAESGNNIFYTPETKNRVDSSSLAAGTGISNNRDSTAVLSGASSTADSKRTSPPKGDQSSTTSRTGTSRSGTATPPHRFTKLDSTTFQSDTLRGRPSDPLLSDKDSTGSRSNWKTNQLYLGHFAISDVENKNHVFEERFSRGAAGLAGARAEPYRIWLEDWEVKNSGTKKVGSQYFPVHIKAEMANGAAVDLDVKAAKPLTLQGDKGYDRKGGEKGNASYYHSFTRMDTEGSLQMNGQQYDVSGSSWMDHEWSTSALDEAEEGWDWFSIQLSNGYDLMYYQLRNADGSVSKFTTGSLVGPDGEKTTINPGDVEIEVLDKWESPHSKSVYPSKWEMRIPKYDLSLDLQTLFNDQEMDVSVRYYEGTVSVSGSINGEDIGGNGFIEMTGYEVEADD